MNICGKGLDGNFSYLESLNKDQRSAVENLDGPLLVLAGAGTGKTRVLTTRLGHLLSTGKAHPGEILAVTFTNKAALEMKTRVSSLLGGRAVDGWWLGTFHSIAARILRRHADIVGLKSNFTILGDDDQIRLLKQILEAEHIDIKKYPPRLLMSFIQKFKDKAKNPSDVNPNNCSDIADGKLLKIYKEYQSRLQILNACDFGDLLMHSLTILRNPVNKDLLEQYQNRFKYILVDEYQDTNTAQYLWLRLLAQKHKNICCVGDDDQSIYGWRGAEIGNILKFEKDFPGAIMIRLEQNYRSTGHILNTANGIIANNKSRLGKNLWSADSDGKKVILRGVWDGMAEAAHVAEQIEDLQKKKISLNEIAILVRASHQTRAFEEKFIKEAIPHKVLAGMRFYERQEIRDIIAYLRIIYQQDDDLALERIINVPKKGIGATTVNKIRIKAREDKISLNDALGLLINSDEFRGSTNKKLSDFKNNLERWRNMQRDISHVELARLILDESGYLDMWKLDKNPESAGRIENLQEFINALNEFDNLEMFLEHVSLVMDTDEKNTDAQVTIMTYHAAKGLEYDVVIMPGWEEELFPNKRALDETGEAGLEEERRLAYVGITRAKKRAFIYFAANRLTYGSWTTCLPSRFIDELPKEHVEVIVETGIYKSSRQSANGQSSYGGGYRGRSAALVEDNFSFSIESEGGFIQGERVFHKKFGYGTIAAIENNKLDIKFDKAGRKKLLDSFVEKTT